jgi:hypothetical protein
MKNVFLPLTLLIVLVYSLALTAHAFGLLPADACRLALFIGLFTAACLLAIVCHSYGAQRSFRAPRLRRRVLRREPIADPFHATWTYQTISS